MKKGELFSLAGRSMKKLAGGVLISLPIFVFWSAAEAKEVRTIVKVPKHYIVKEGDNLWDLAKGRYEDPYQWRVIWRKNRYVKDPNLIFPGDQLLLPGEFVDKEVIEIVEDAPVAEVVEEKSRIPETYLPPPQPEPISLVPELLYRTSGYIANREEWAGRIVAGPQERSIFGKRDELMVAIEKEVEEGEKFLVVKPIKEVTHPISGEELGTLIQEVGIVEVRRVGGDTTTVYVIDSFSDIQVDDRLVKLDREENTLIDLSREIKKKKIDGYIVLGKEEMDVFGEGSVVYVDAGLNSGVEVGDKFSAYIKGETIEKNWLGRKGKTLPKTLLGLIQVFHVRQQNSTAIVRSSRKEIFLGTTVEYHKE